MKEKTIYMDSTTTNYSIYSSVVDKNEIIEGTSIASLKKARKNKKPHLGAWVILISCPVGSRPVHYPGSLWRDRAPLATPPIWGALGRSGPAPNDGPLELPQTKLRVQVHLSADLALLPPLSHVHALQV